MNDSTTTTTIVVSSPLVTGVQLIITLTRVGSSSSSTPARGDAHSNSHPTLLLLASSLQKKTFIHHHFSPSYTSLLCFFFFFKLLRPFYIFVQVAQPTRTKRKDQSAQEELLERTSRPVKWDEIGTKREIVQMTSTGSRRVAGHILLPWPCLLGSLALAGLVLFLSGVTSQGVPRSRLVPPRHYIWVIN